MKKRLTRLVAFVLAGCLTADPALASAVHLLPSLPSSVATINPNQFLFNQEAFSVRAPSYMREAYSPMLFTRLVRRPLRSYSRWIMRSGPTLLRWAAAPAMLGAALYQTVATTTAAAAAATAHTANAVVQGEVATQVMQVGSSFLIKGGARLLDIFKANNILPTEANLKIVQAFNDQLHTGAIRTIRGKPFMLMKDAILRLPDVLFPSQTALPAPPSLPELPIPTFQTPMGSLPTVDISNPILPQILHILMLVGEVALVAIVLYKVYALMKRLPVKKHVRAFTDKVLIRTYALFERFFSTEKPASEPVRPAAPVPQRESTLRLHLEDTDPLDVPTARFSPGSHEPLPSGELRLKLAPVSPQVTPLPDIQLKDLRKKWNGIRFAVYADQKEAEKVYSDFAASLNTIPKNTAAKKPWNDFIRQVQAEHRAVEVAIGPGYTLVEASRVRKPPVRHARPKPAWAGRAMRLDEDDPTIPLVRFTPRNPLASAPLRLTLDIPKDPEPSRLRYAKAGAPVDNLPAAAFESRVVPKPVKLPRPPRQVNPGSGFNTLGELLQKALQPVEPEAAVDAHPVEIPTANGVNDPEPLNLIQVVLAEIERQLPADPITIALAPAPDTDMLMLPFDAPVEEPAVQASVQAEPVVEPTPPVIEAPVVIETFHIPAISSRAELLKALDALGIWADVEHPERGPEARKAFLKMAREFKVENLPGKKKEIEHVEARQKEINTRLTLLGSLSRREEELTALREKLKSGSSAPDTSNAALATVQRMSMEVTNSKIESLILEIRQIVQGESASEIQVDLMKDHGDNRVLEQIGKFGRDAITQISAADRVYLARSNGTIAGFAAHVPQRRYWVLKSYEWVIHVLPAYDKMGVEVLLRNQTTSEEITAGRTAAPDLSTPEGMLADLLDSEKKYRANKQDKLAKASLKGYLTNLDLPELLNPTIVKIYQELGPEILGQSTPAKTTRPTAAPQDPRAQTAAPEQPRAASPAKPAEAETPIDISEASKGTRAALTPAEVQFQGNLSMLESRVRQGRTSLMDLRKQYTQLFRKHSPNAATAQAEAIKPQREKLRNSIALASEKAVLNDVQALSGRVSRHFKANTKPPETLTLATWTSLHAAIVSQWRNVRRWERVHNQPAGPNAAEIQTLLDTVAKVLADIHKNKPIPPKDLDGLNGGNGHKSSLPVVQPPLQPEQGVPATVPSAAHPAPAAAQHRTVQPPQRLTADDLAKQAELETVKHAKLEALKQKIADTGPVYTLENYARFLTEFNQIRGGRNQVLMNGLSAALDEVNAYGAKAAKTAKLEERFMTHMPFLAEGIYLLLQINPEHYSEEGWAAWSKNLDQIFERHIQNNLFGNSKAESDERRREYQKGTEPLSKYPVPQLHSDIRNALRITQRMAELRQMDPGESGSPERTMYMNEYTALARLIATMDSKWPETKKRLAAYLDKLNPQGNKGEPAIDLEHQTVPLLAPETAMAGGLGGSFARIAQVLKNKTFFSFIFAIGGMIYLKSLVTPVLAFHAATPAPIPLLEWVIGLGLIIGSAVLGSPELRRRTTALPVIARTLASAA